MKKRFYQHILFWMLVSAQGTLLQYSWRQAGLANKSGLQLVALCFIGDLFLLPVKIGFTFFSLLKIKQGFLQQGNLASILGSIGLALVDGIFLHRFIGEFYVAPYLNPGFLPSFHHVFSVPLALISLI